MAIASWRIGSSQLPGAAASRLCHTRPAQCGPRSPARPSSITPAFSRSRSRPSPAASALAAVRLLWLYIEYFDGRFEKYVLSQSITIHIYTDSESMITKLDKIREYPKAKHKMTLHPEWDVLSALHNTLVSFPTGPSIEWVKSHQDDSRPVADLKLGAKLNILADKLANEGSRSFISKNIVPMNPHSCVQVHIMDAR